MAYLIKDMMVYDDDPGFPLMLDYAVHAGLMVWTLCPVHGLRPWNPWLQIGTCCRCAYDRRNNNS